MIFLYNSIICNLDNLTKHKLFYKMLFECLCLTEYEMI